MWEKDADFGHIEWLGHQLGYLYGEVRSRIPFRTLRADENALEEEDAGSLDGNLVANMRFSSAPTCSCLLLATRP